MPNIGFWAVAGASAPAVAGAYDHLATTILSSTTTSVTFDTSTYAALGYKHLQIRYVVRGDRANVADAMLTKLNGDSGANYSTHVLEGQGSSVTSSYESGNPNAMDYTFISANNATSNVFAAGVMDFLDAFSTTKYKTRRVLSGVSGAGSFSSIDLTSNAWRNTAAITSIAISVRYGSGFLTGSRFSIYGVKG